MFLVHALKSSGESGGDEARLLLSNSMQEIFLSLHPTQPSIFVKKTDDVSIL